MRQLSKTTRRSFLKKSGIATVGFMGLYQFVQPNAFAGAAHAKAGYGALLPDPAGILNLPKGFSYKVISKIGQKMSDGLLTPGNPDGMGTFKGENSRVLIVRNHEISPDDLEKGAFGKDNELFKNISADLLYETGKGQLPGLGGTTTLVYNPKTQEIGRAHV